MNLLRLFFISVLVLFALSYPTTAQEQAKEILAPKIAFIDSRLFADKREGILVYVKAINELEAEFKPYVEELEALAAKMEALQSDIEKARTSPTPDLKLIKEKQDEIERLKREIDPYFNHQRYYIKRERVVVKPVEDDIYKEISLYAKQFGIKVVIDISKLGEAIVYSEDADFTKAFIAYYNTKHPLPPVTNSQTQVKLSEPR